MTHRDKSALWLLPYFAFIFASVIVAFFPFIIFLVIAGIIVFTAGWIMEHFNNKNKPIG